MIRPLILVPFCVGLLAAQSVPERFRDIYDRCASNAYMQKQLAFLFEHMPAADLASLSPEMLLENVFYAVRARGASKWSMGVPNELFQNYVLPYAQADEKREDWRKEMYERCAPLVADCTSAGEAAKVLNEKLFDLVNVHYSTKRRRALQAPGESIAQGRATCTGLSILLADACRSVGVPARIVSVKWPHKRGNHTWVEIWDGRRWRFCGADEPDPKGFDRAWFVGDAKKCDVEDKRNRIYAVSFAKTGTTFVPGWSQAELFGTDVTSRYSGKQPDDPDAALRTQLGRYFASDVKRQQSFEFDRNLDEELKTQQGDARLRALVWRAFKQHEHERLQPDHLKSVVTVAGESIPFGVRQVGVKPATGWPLVIVLSQDAEGADGAYFRDHAKSGGYLRCTLRVPTEPDRIVPVVERLIRQFSVCGGIDADRVVAVGHGAAGEAAIRLAMALPHRFAAVHASSAAPWFDAGAAVGLHTLYFSLLVGARDPDGDRVTGCRKFGAELARLHEQMPDLYPGSATLVDGCGPDDLPDRDILATLTKKTRAPMPPDAAFVASAAGGHHYYLHVDAGDTPVRVESGQAKDQMWSFVTTRKVAVSAWFDARSVDMSQLLSVIANENSWEVVPSPSLRVLCKTMQRTGDPWLAASWIVKGQR